MTGSLLFEVADAGAQTQTFKQSSVPGLALRFFPSMEVSLCSCCIMTARTSLYLLYTHETRGSELDASGGMTGEVGGDVLNVAVLGRKRLRSWRKEPMVNGSVA